MRIRFSLKSLLLFLLTATLAASNLFTSHRLKRVNDENVRLRHELGYLTIEDPSKLNVVALPAYEELTWRWRVYVPEGSKLVLKEATRNIPEFGIPAEWDARILLSPGEYLATAAVRRDRLGKWQLRLSAGGSSTRTPIREASSWWLDQKTGISSIGAGDAATEAKRPDKPLRLLRVIAIPQGKPVVVNIGDDFAPFPGKPNRVGDGLMIWIDKATADEAASSFADGIGEASAPHSPRRTQDVQQALERPVRPS